MNNELKDLLKNCLESLNNRTEEDIRKMQELYDREVGRYSNVTPSQEFEIQYPPTLFTDEELLEILGEENYYTFEVKTKNEKLPVSYNKEDTWEIINFEDNNYAKVA